MTFEWVLQAPTEAPEEAAVPPAHLLQPTTRPAQPKGQPGAIPKGSYPAKLHTQDIMLPRTGFAPQCAIFHCSGRRKAYNTHTICALGCLVLMYASCL